MEDYHHHSSVMPEAFLGPAPKPVEETIEEEKTEVIEAAL